MNWTDLNLIPAMPEIVLLSALGIVLLVDLWLKDEDRYVTHLLVHAFHRQQPRNHFFFVWTGWPARYRE